MDKLFGIAAVRKAAGINIHGHSLRYYLRLTANFVIQTWCKQYTMKNNHASFLQVDRLGLRSDGIVQRICRIFLNSLPPKPKAHYK